MQLSTSGRVILVDDKFDDAVPLMRVLSKNSIPFLYFDGAFGDLPETSFTGIRFVFLDLDLKGAPKATGTDRDKTMASYVASVLTRLIAPDNGPLVIICWSNHSTEEEILRLVHEYCSSRGVLWNAIFDLEKHACKDKHGEYDLDVITRKLEEKLGALGAFHVYVLWENLLNSSGKKFVSDLAKMVPAGVEWANKTSEMFHTLYKAYVDDNELDNPHEQLKCCCTLLNRSFSDTLQQDTEKELIFPTDLALTAGSGCETPIKAKLNSMLFSGHRLLPQPSPGYVYEVAANEVMKKALLKTFFVGHPPERSKLCKVVITPECDLAKKKKTLKIMVETAEGTAEHNVHRLLYGLLYECGASKIDKKDALFPIGPLWVDDKVQHLIFDFRTLSFEDESLLTEAPLLSLARDLLFDLQSKAANNVNRLGNFLLK